MENVIALAVLGKHSSCSETSVRAFPRVRPVIPAVLTVSVQGTTVPSTGFASAFGYGMQTDSTTKAPTSGYLTWSPPV
jgi:hypothetical protein